MSRHLKLSPPAVLPPTGVTSVSFKAWHRQLIAYLEQDVNSPHFLQDGLYAEWQARGKNHHRIAALHDDDPERIAHMDCLVAALNMRRDCTPMTPGWTTTPRKPETVTWWLSSWPATPS